MAVTISERETPDLSYFKGATSHAWTINDEHMEPIMPLAIQSSVNRNMCLLKQGLPSPSPLAAHQVSEKGSDGTLSGPGPAAASLWESVAGSSRGPGKAFPSSSSNSQTPAQTIPNTYSLAHKHLNS